MTTKELTTKSRFERPTAGDPSVWIGCLACYNAGELVGEWYHIEYADRVTPEDVHNDGGTIDCDCDDVEYHDEMWVFDSEVVPLSERDPMSAARIWRESLDEAYRDGQLYLFLDWLHHNGYSLENGSYERFRNNYQGSYDSLEDYAREIIEEQGILDSAPEELARYFDYKAYARDLKMDGYYELTDPEYITHIFSSY